MKIVKPQNPVKDCFWNEILIGVEGLPEVDQCLDSIILPLLGLLLLPDCTAFSPPEPLHI